MADHRLPRACVAKLLPPHLAVAAAHVAVTTNPANAPRLPHPDLAAGMTPLELAGMTRLFWPPGTGLKISLNGGSPATRDRLWHAIQEWPEACNIHFVRAEPDVADVRFGFVPDGRSWSVVGQQAKLVPRDEPTGNFGWLDESESDEEFRRTGLHELGHALGLLHEFQLGLALGTVHPNRAPMYQYYMGPPNNWSREDVETQVLNPMDLAGVVHSDWDATSIMEYWMQDNWFVPPMHVPGNSTLSAQDRDRIAAWYGPPVGLPPPQPVVAAPEFFPAWDRAHLDKIWSANALFLSTLGRARVTARVGPLSFSNSLPVAARQLAESCARFGFLRPFSGADPAVEPALAVGRAEAVAGATWVAGPFPTPAEAPSVATLVRDWLAGSAATGLLDPAATHAGLGWSYGDDGRLFVVAIVGRQDAPTPPGALPDA